MGDGTRWAPMDDDNRFLGAITLRYALAQSRNVVAVKLAQDLGVDRVIEYAAHGRHRAARTEALARAGLVGRVAARPGRRLRDARQPGRAHRALADSPRARLARHARARQHLPAADRSGQRRRRLRHDLDAGVGDHRGTGYPNADIGRPAAGKTGTTSSFRDAWFVGYTPDLVAAVWIGNDDYSRMNESYGGNIPARIWARFISARSRTSTHDFVLPVGEVHKVKLCGTGKDEVFLAGPSRRICGRATTATPRRSAAAAATARRVPAAAARGGPGSARSPGRAPRRRWCR